MLDSRQTSADLNERSSNEIKQLQLQLNERERILAENSKLNDQIQMWKVVEALQNRATVGNGEDMTTILEEESVNPMENTNLEMSEINGNNVQGPLKIASCRSLFGQMTRENSKEFFRSIIETTPLECKPT